MALGAPMKLKEAVSWLTGTLQRNLIPLLEECWERPLTGKERQLVSILELVQIEKNAYFLSSEKVMVVELRQA